jgi:hypothetical protein
MKNTFILATTLSAFAFTGLVNAQAGVAGSGTLGVTANIQGSILLTFSAATSGAAVTGTGTSAGSLAFGTVQMYGGSVASGVTRTLTGTTGFTLATPINIDVEVANSASAAYTLAAALTTADAVNTWTFNGVILSATTASITVAGLYGTTPYGFVLGVPATEATSSLSNTINFTATTN